MSKRERGLAGKQGNGRKARKEAKRGVGDGDGGARSGGVWGGGGGA